MVLDAMLFIIQTRIFTRLWLCNAFQSGRFPQNAQVKDYRRPKPSDTSVETPSTYVHLSSSTLIYSCLR